MRKWKGFLSLVLCLFLTVTAFSPAFAEEAELSVTGTIIGIETYGHAVLDISIEDFENAGFNLGDVVTVTTEHYTGDMPYFNGYYVDRGESLLRADPGTKNIAVCINYGSFAEAAGAKKGDAVTITLKEDDGALAEQEINALVYTNVRSDYGLDMELANFRPIVMGDIAEGRLYRSASPVDDRYGRAAYANELAELVRISAIMNMAITDEDILRCFEEEGFRSDYYRELYEDGRVIALGMPIAFDTPEFAQGIVRGLTFLSGQEPPYLVHCTEGKDRAGFASMVLEALMGASVEEIVADYMVSYENYYGVEPDSEKYDRIVEKNIMQMLPVIAGNDDPENVDLAAATEAYLIRNGMDREAVLTLREKLSGRSEEVAAVILHTNDVHVGFQNNIGYDGLALYKKELEAKYDHVLLVDAGDAIQGAALGAISKGAEIIRMMNRLGYDIAIPGNHEFDFGFDVLDDCSEQLDCGYICANFCTTGGEPVFEPWRILDAGDLKIGFVGTVTPDTFIKSAIKNIVNEVGEPMYDFLADETGDRLCEALQKSIDEVRANGADYVILVAHLGLDADGGSIYSSDAIVKKMTGIDAVIDGHTHDEYSTLIPDKEGKMIPIGQTGTKLQAIGQLTIYKDGRLEETLVDLVPDSSVIPSEIAVRRNTERNVDPEMMAFLDGITASYAPVMERRIGYLPVDLIKMVGGDDESRNGENGLCEFAADAYRAVGNTEAALLGAGSVRTNLYAGEVTFQDMADILPYFNEVITARVSGRMILDALEFGVSFLPNEFGGFPQVSGITFRIDPEIETGVKMNEKKQFVSVEGERRVSDVMIGGSELDPKRWYTLTITQYLFTGGDGYTMFEDAEILSDTMLTDVEAVIKYLEEDLEGVIPESYEKPQGRIQWTTH